MIAPSHGFIIRDEVQSFIDIYDNMSKNTDLDKKALILYSTMTGNTKKIANIFKEKFEEQNITSELMDVNKDPMDNIMTAINEADAIFFGSSTKYGDMIGNMEEVLKNLKTLNLENKLGAAFGSYGWSGEAIEVIQDYLNKTNLRSLSTSDIIKSTGMTDIELPLRIRFSSKEDNLKSIDRIVTYTSDLLFSTI